MTPSSHRLPRAGFEQVVGMRRAASQHFSIFYQDDAPLWGGAAVVSKKVGRRAVDRHLLKRRIKAVMQSWVVPGRVIVIHARKGAATRTFPELKTELAALLRQSLNSGIM